MKTIKYFLCVVWQWLKESELVTRFFLGWLCVLLVLISCTIWCSSMGKCITGLEIFGGLTLICIIISYFVRPVDRNRILYGKESYTMFLCVFVLVTSLILSICGINHALSNSNHYLEPSKITNLHKFDSLEIYPSLHDNTCYLIKTPVINENRVISKSDSVAEENFWAIVSQFADPGNLPSSERNGRGMALFLAFAGIIFLSGLLVSSFVNWISIRREYWKKGLIRYNTGLKNYVVIIGVNEQTAAIAKQSLKREGVDYILIQTRQDVEKMRQRLDLDLDREEETKVVLYFAERTSEEDIKQLQLENAIEVYILGEDISLEKEEDHDAYNIECLNLVSDYFKEKENVKRRKKFYGKKSILKCNVNFEYQSTFTTFKVTHIYQKLSKYIEFVPFNIHELWAKKVLVDNFAIVPGNKKGEVNVQRYLPLEGKEGISVDSDKTVHLVILGMNQMGTAFAVQAALLAHYPNFFKDERHTRKTTITFIDDHAIEEGEFFRGRFESLFKLSSYRVIDSAKENILYNEYSSNLIVESNENRRKRLEQTKHLCVNNEELLDIQWEFIQGNVASDKIIDYLVTLTNTKTKIVTIAICFNHPQLSIAAAMYLRGNIIRNALQVLVYQRNSFDLLDTVANGDTDWNRYKNMVPFGMIEGSYSGDSFNSTTAKLEHYTYIGKKNNYEKNSAEDVHEVYPYKLYDEFHNTENFDKKLIKKIEKLWKELGIVQQYANIDMVETIPTKLRSLGIPEYDGNIQKVKIAMGGEYGIIEEKYREQFDIMAKSEHMRWMMERLIMGFRALTKEEQKQICREVNKKAQKEKLKVRHRAHLDICSNEMLSIVDNNMCNNDRDAIAFIPFVLQSTERMNMLKLKESVYDKKENGILTLIFEHRNLKFKHLEPGKERKIVNGKDEIQQLLVGKDVLNYNLWISDTPVTQKQWEEVMGKSDVPNELASEDSPMINISKNDVDDFLLVLRKKTGLFLTLPSLKEWRYAAVLSTTYLDSILKNIDVDNMSDSKKISSKTQEKARKYIKIAKGEEVKRNRGKNKNSNSKVKANHNKEMHSQQTNNYGIYDMLGNVWEWTREKDECGRYCFCGGSWRFMLKECDLRDEYWKMSWDESSKSEDLGFRLVWKFDGGEDNLHLDSADNSDGIIQWFKEEGHRLINIKPGYFVMGAKNEFSGEDSADANETPRHTVRITNDYYICQVPVTQYLWNAVSKYLGKAYKENPTTNRIGDDIPQTDISWDDINNFLGTLNKELRHKGKLQQVVCESIIPINTEDPKQEEINIKNREKLKKEISERKLTFRLPTEAEWEYAAKGGRDCQIDEKDCKGLKEGYTTSNIKEVNKDKYGEEESHYIDFEDELYIRKQEIEYGLYAAKKSAIAENVAWFDQPTIHEVAEKEPNALELYDMSGNVWEWCYDFYISDMYEACKIGTNPNIQQDFTKNEYNEKGYITDPVALDNTYSAHVFRGGSWRSTEWDCRCTRANFWIASHKSNDLGFRLVLGRPIKEK